MIFGYQFIIVEQTKLRIFVVIVWSYI